MGAYPPGMSQTTHDREFDQLGYDPDQPEVGLLSCGHYGTDDSAERIGNNFVCGDCFQEAENIRGAFPGVELGVLIVALQDYGAAKLGNHALFDALLTKLKRAAAVGR